MDEKPKNGKGFGLAPETEERLTTMGIVLDLIHGAEHAIAGVLPFTLAKESTITVETIEREKEGARRQTLGQLMAKVRERADVMPEFDQILDSFLVHRNQFIHAHVRHDPRDPRAYLVFLTRLVREAELVASVFSGVLFRFAAAQGEEGPMSLLNPGEKEQAIELMRLSPSVRRR